MKVGVKGYDPEIGKPLAGKDRAFIIAVRRRCLSDELTAASAPTAPESTAKASTQDIAVQVACCDLVSTGDYTQSLVVNFTPGFPDHLELVVLAWLRTARCPDDPRVRHRVFVHKSAVQGLIEALGRALQA